MSKMKFFTQIVIGMLFFTAISANVLPESRVVNGTDAPLGKYPSMVSLQSFGSHNCGGSIVSENFFLTAAHCVIGSSPQYLSVLVGTNNLLDGGSRHQVAEIFIHEGYNAGEWYINDIAVVRVEDAFVYDSTTSAVVLPEQGQQSPGGSAGTLVGWGIPYSGGSIMNVQQEVELVVFSDEECDSIHGGKPHPTNICAGVPEGGKGQCSGDSGGPLFVNGYQAGIVSWSVKPCTVPPYPGVYTEVSPYVDWIKSKIY